MDGMSTPPLTRKCLILLRHREAEGLERRQRDAEDEAKGARRRREAAAAADRQELAAALAEGADARDLAEDLRVSLEVT